MEAGRDVEQSVENGMEERLEEKRKSVDTRKDMEDSGNLRRYNRIWY